MFNVFVFIVSLCVFFITKYYIFNPNTKSYTYGGVSRYYVACIIMFIVSIPSTVAFGYISYLSIMSVLNSL